MATLVHDDIIDEARLRRGRITAQEKFGNDVAVFVGDFLLTKSYSLFVDNLSQHSLVKLNKVVKMVCIGEIRQYEEKYDLDLSLIDYFKRIRRKTALLFAISAYIGAYEAGVRGKGYFNFINLPLRWGWLSRSGMIYWTLLEMKILLAKKLTRILRPVFIHCLLSAC